MKTIDDLRSEHDAIGQMIDRFEAEIEAAVECGVIDADAIDQLLVFFEEQVDRHHHGKQERVLFPRLLTRAHGQEAELVRPLIYDYASEREMLALMRAIMSGEVTPTLIAAIIVGLRVKKETIGEIAAAAEVMREFATKVPVKDPDRLIDVVGTGGDGANTFNISTASTFVCAAAGARTGGCA